jgi:dolichol-phosphate mannosyltransferase
MESAMSEARRKPAPAELAVLPQAAPIDLSIVVPVYDEEDSLAPLFERLLPVLQNLDCRYEILVVNDGSKDRSIDVLRHAAEDHAEIRVIAFRRNYGQTAALMAGFDNARGDIIITIDADLQNDPADIPLLIAKLREGYDVVSGWRTDRKDAAISRKLPSQIANKLISKISGVKLNDYGCTLKAYRRDILKNVRLYGEMHRLIPIYASWMGAKVVEMPVRHHARQFGKSKYGIGRVLKVILDLTVVKFLETYLVKPIYLFGGFAALSVLASLGVLGLALADKFLAHVSLIQTPMPLLSAMLLLMGCTSMLMGLLAEMIMRTYFEAQDLKPYLIRERINFGSNT